MRLQISGGAAAAALVSMEMAHGAADAQPVSGIYIGGGAGITDLQDQNINSVISGPGPLGPRYVNTNGASFRSLTGFAAVGAAGWGFGNGLRVEIEGSYRNNQLHRLMGDPTKNPEALSGTNQTYAAMANVLYDAPLDRWFGFTWFTPYIGAGVG